MQDSARDRIAANVRAELARRGKSQRDAAKALGLPQSGIWLRIRGERAFKAEEIAALAEWLGVPSDRLLIGPDVEVAA